MEIRPDSSLGEKLRDGSLYERAPAHLRAQVLARLREEANESRDDKRDRKRDEKRPFKWFWSNRIGLPIPLGSVNCRVLGSALDGRR